MTLIKYIIKLFTTITEYIFKLIYKPIYRTINKLPNTNYDIIKKALIYKQFIKALYYKQLNPPKIGIHKFNSNSLGTVLSKGVHLTFNVEGMGTIREYFIYDINNKICKYKNSYYSEIQRKKDMEKNRRRMKKDMEKNRRRKKPETKTTLPNL